jgi:hypothetical protein
LIAWINLVAAGNMLFAIQISAREAFKSFKEWLQKRREAGKVGPTADGVQTFGTSEKGPRMESQNFEDLSQTKGQEIKILRPPETYNSSERVSLRGNEYMTSM